MKSRVERSLPLQCAYFRTDELRSRHTQDRGNAHRAYRRALFLVRPSYSRAQNRSHNILLLVKNIVLADADMAAAVAGAVWSAFFNSGQVCAAASRFYIHESIYERFTDEFVKATSELKVGDPMDMETSIGPLAYEAHSPSSWSKKYLS